MSKNIAATLVCGVVVVAPLPFGSAQPFWGAIWCALLGLALLLAPSTTLERGQRTAVRLVFVAVGAWCFLVALQYIPLASVLPAGRWWNEVAPLLDSKLVTPKVAAYGEIPIFAIVPPLALTMALLSGIIFGSEPGFAKRIYGWVGGAGLIYAGYAVFAGVTDPGMLLWRQKTAYVDSITGTFVNHNTAATFFGCVAVIWYVRFLRDLSRRVNFNRGRDLGYIVTKVVNLPRQEMVSLLAVLFLLGTTFMTRSRAGSLLTIGVLGCITMLYVYREIRAARGLLVLSVLTLAVGVVAVNTVGDRFIHEIEIRGTTDTARVEGWLSTLAIIRDHPWFGVGLGTFETVFPAYRVPAGGVWGVWDHAHSTPLELMAEMGIPFGLLILTLWVIMLAVLVQASAKGAQGRSLATAGVGIGLLGTLHSLVDFSLQIPGFSIVCCALMGASLAGTLASKVSKKVPLPLTANDDIAGFAPGIRAAHE